MSLMRCYRGGLARRSWDIPHVGASEKKAFRDECFLSSVNRPDSSRGGFGTKIHVAVDGLGNPVEILLTPGQAHDAPQAEALLGDHKPGAVIADKGYDSDALAESIASRGAEVVIPPLGQRTQPRAIDRVLYKERNLAERFISRLKHYRRVATRYEKTARNHLAFWQLASIMVLLA